MPLWGPWFEAIWLLRPAFSRLRTFLWFVTAVAGLTVRTDLLGVTSIVRALRLHPDYYQTLLDLFHSKAVKLNLLVALWVQAVLKLFTNAVLVNGRHVLIGDGTKPSKRGEKMPGVKLLHNSSGSNNKPEYFMGHSLQAVSMVVEAGKSFFAVPLTARIHEGTVFSNRDRSTLLDKMLSLLEGLNLALPYYFVGDAYYGSGKMIKGLLKNGNHLVTRMKSNAVAYIPHSQEGDRKPGRPKIYGQKIKLKSLLKKAKSMQEAPSPVYGENNKRAKRKGQDGLTDDGQIMIRYRMRDLLWRPAGIVVRFVAVRHPVRGWCILMCTDTSLDPLEIIRLYGLRFKIELGFKQAVHTIGAYAYHFWMSAMKPLKRGNGDQFMHREDEEYREAVRRKIRAYHIFIQAGVVCQGLMQYLSASFADRVSGGFGCWLRTVRDGVPPSEFSVGLVMRESMPEFLTAAGQTNIFAKFVLDHRAPGQSEDVEDDLKEAA
jgi:hypothetical protein